MRNIWILSFPAYHYIAVLTEIMFLLVLTEKNKFIKNPSVAEEKNGDKMAVDSETEVHGEDKNTLQEEVSRQDGSA
jgi:hypothetical protein